MKLLLALVVAATTYVPSASEEVILFCLERANLRSRFSLALSDVKGAERSERRDLINLQLQQSARNRNLDGNPDNDISDDEIRLALMDLDWAYENPRWTGAQVFDINFQRCLQANKEKVKKS